MKINKLKDLYLNRKKNKEPLISEETITHFRCSVCLKWWSIANIPDKYKIKSDWICPWCGCWYGGEKNKW